HEVTHVAMESTGVYWRPVYAVLEGLMTVLLVNARHVKMVPGRKTDVRDCEWLAQLLECGLLRSSFVPPRPIRDLRDLTRLRKTHLSLIDARDVHIATLDARIAEAMAPFADAAALAQTMPGVAARAAQAILAETGMDMATFPTADNFASWARLCPGNNESAGKRRSATTGQGATWLRATLQEVAWAAAKTKKSYYRALFHRLKARSDS